MIAAFNRQFGGENSQLESLHAFHATFVCMGLITCASAWIFWQLDIDTQAPPAHSTMPMADAHVGGSTLNLARELSSDREHCGVGDHPCPKKAIETEKSMIEPMKNYAGTQKSYADGGSRE